MPTLPRIIKFVFTCAILGVAVYVAFGFHRSETARLDLSNSLLPKGFLNNEIMAVVKSFPQPRNNTSKKKGAVDVKNREGKVKPKTNVYGITRDISYQHRRIASAGAYKKAYCSGITFQVFMEACAKAAGKDFVLKGLSPSNFNRFRKDWYGTDGNKRTMVNALVSRDLGIEIKDPADAAPGDFVQFWLARRDMDIRSFF